MIGAGVRSAGVQRLQEHAQQTASDSDQLVQRILASYQGAGRGTPIPDNPQANPEGQQAGQQQVRASIQIWTLAQQAQQVVQTLQRISTGSQERRPE
jgi:hypothetical protein